MVNMLSRNDDSLIARWWWSLDKNLFKYIIVLILIGIFISITAPNYNGQKPTSIASSLNMKYLMFAGIGFVIFIFTSFLNIKWIKRLALIGVILLILTLIALPFIGIEKKGAIRWIAMFGFSIQPSEFIKPLFAVVSALLFSAQFKSANIPGVLLSFGLFFVFALLLVIQPDMGQTILMTGIWMAQLFVIGLTAVGIFSGLAIIIGLLFLGYFTVPHFRDRINGWLFPADSDTFQIDKSMQSFADGGWFSFDWNAGVNKYKIPDVNTDFIFAVIAEEGGVISALLVLFVLVMIVYLMFNKAREQDDLFIMLSIVGIATQFAMQSAINIASTIDLIPTKGMTLPLISTGGSSYLAMCIGLGIVISLTRKRDTI